MKHFANGSPIDPLRVDWEGKLVEILVGEAPTNHDTLEVVAGTIVQMGVEEEEEEGGNLGLLH